MKYIVIDTNVLVSSAISHEGNPARIMDLVSDRYVKMFYSACIMAEYKRVLAYERIGILAHTQGEIIKKIEELGFLIEPEKSEIPLPDETDRMFYDAARASDAVLITGNLKHYPVDPSIMTPADFLVSYCSDEYGNDYDSF